jgi:hypothetical protein
VFCCEFARNNAFSQALWLLHYKLKGDVMLRTIAIILVVLWLLGFALHIAGGLIHLVLVVAVIIFVYDLVVGRRKV